MYETQLLAEPGVVVTTARFVVGFQTYPISSITTVAPFTVQPSRGGAYLLGAFVSLPALGTLLGGASLGSGTGIFFGLVLAGIAALCFWHGAQKKAEHGLLVATSGMQVRALVTHDLGQVQRVLGALNHAIASR
jgi:hypothetical protein